MFPPPKALYLEPIKTTVQVFDAPFRITQVITLARTPALQRRADSGRLHHRDRHAQVPGVRRSRLLSARHGAALLARSAQALASSRYNSFPMSLLPLAASALTLGVLHGLGGDHLMAIAALSVGRAGDRRHRVIRTAVSFACGHTLVLATGAVIAVLFGVALPAAVSSGAERIGGLLLIALGVTGLWGIASGRAYGHIHREADGPSRWHVHVGHPSGHSATHAHPILPTAMGAVFAVSSLRALMLLQPFGADARALALPGVLLLVVLFGLGILLSMSIFGMLLARVLSIRAVSVLGQFAAGLVAIASIVLGAYWMST